MAGPADAHGRQAVEELLREAGPVGGIVLCRPAEVDIHGPSLAWIDPVRRADVGRRRMDVVGPVRGGGEWTVSCTEPIASRPHMPGYGIVGPDEGRGLLPWSWAEERLVASHDYWLATVLPSGAPHVMPVWGVWADDAAWFSSSPGSRKARNLAADPRAVITTDNPSQPVVVHGAVVPVVSATAIATFTEWVNAKYETDISVSFFTDNACFRLEPSQVFGLDEADFTTSPTRWVFPDQV